MGPHTLTPWDPTLSDMMTWQVSHPFFLHSHGDVWLWERLLEQTSISVPFHPEASLLWVCLAASAAEKHDVGNRHHGTHPTCLD